MLAILPLPFTTTAQRRELRNELVTAYNPPFQREGALHSSGDHLPSAHTWVTQPEAKRRRIGFLPDVEKAA